MTTVIVHEVGLRDGLQVERTIVPTAKKLDWLRTLIEANIDIVQVGSFVHPEKVPQMADTDEIFRVLHQESGRRTKLSGLVLNEKGLERALACEVDLICLGVSASETHSRKNTGMGSSDAQRRIVQTAKLAKQAGRQVQVSVQSAFGCGFEGPIAEARVLQIVSSYLEAGLYSISLADTAGHAHPRQVRDLFEQILRLDPQIRCTCHFHDTYGMGMANVFAAIDTGVESFETSFGGLGGCPFTKVAAGNVPTEDLLHTLQRIGMRKDIQLDMLVALAKDVASHLERELPGRVYKTGPLSY